MQKIRTHWILLLSAGALLLMGCSEESSKNEDGKPFVVATTGMIADAVEAVGGNEISVTALMGAGVDPHLYKASQGDLVALQKAEIIFYNGLFLEGKMGEVLSKLQTQKPVVPVAESIPKEKRIAFTFGNNSSAYTDDPHVWFDVQLWKLVVEEIYETLATTYPEKQHHFREHADDYQTRLDSLNAYAKERVEAVPEEARVLLTAHDAFGYFGKAYGFSVYGLQGISTASEYGLRDIQKIVKIITQQNIKAVFVESSVSPRSIEAVVQGARDSGHDVTIGGTLFSDAMGEKGTTEGTYFGMVKHNIDTIVDALK